MEPFTIVVSSVGMFRQLSELLIPKGESVFGSKDTDIKKLRDLLIQMEGCLKGQQSMEPCWVDIVGNLATEAQNAIAAYDHEAGRYRGGHNPFKKLARNFIKFNAKCKLSKKYVEIYGRLKALYTNRVLLFQPQPQSENLEVITDLPEIHSVIIPQPHSEILEIITDFPEIHSVIIPQPQSESLEVITDLPEIHSVLITQLQSEMLGLKIKVGCITSSILVWRLSFAVLASVQ